MGDCSAKCKHNIMLAATFLFLLYLPLEVFTIQLKRSLHVPVQHDPGSELCTYSGVHHYSECARKCHGVFECLAISYSSHNNECKTYSERFSEDDSADISLSTMYFSRVIEQDCSDLHDVDGSGVYQIHPVQGGAMDVFCDVVTADGPWTVIHNRQAGDVDFYRNWEQYKTGFGDLQGDFWLGLDHIHVLTTDVSRLRIELEAWNGTLGYAEYTEFQIANESDKYRLHVDGFSGNITNHLRHVNGVQFSTFDSDNDEWIKSCTIERQNAGWYKVCGGAGLNGRYEEDNGDSHTSMHWKHFFPGRIWVPLKKARMLVKRKP